MIIHLRGEKVATIKQIAEITNVSRGTIDRVLNNRGGVNPETEKKVRAAIEALNYLPNKAGMNLAIRKKKLKFGFILFSPSNYNPFFNSVESGIKMKAGELEEFGVSVDIRYTGFNEIEKQLELLDFFESEGYHGIAIVALNTNAISEKIKELSDNGIPVVTVNTDIPDSNRLAYVGSNYYKSGETAANMMGLITGGKANIGIVMGFYNIMCITQRSEGFVEYLSKNYPDIHIVGTVTNNHYDEIESYLITQKLLKDHPEIDALFLAAAGATGACKAIVENNPNVKVIAYDCVPATKQLLEQGVIDVVIDQEPFYQGSKPLELLFEASTVGINSIDKYYYTDAIIKIRGNL